MNFPPLPLHLTTNRTLEYFITRSFCPINFLFDVSYLNALDAGLMIGNHRLDIFQHGPGIRGTRQYFGYGWCPGVLYTGQPEEWTSGLLTCMTARIG